MNFWSPQALAQAAGGQWLTPPAGGDAAPRAGLTIDSRAVHPGAGAGQVFLAIRGEKFDGHDFLIQAAKAGAGMLVASDQGKALKAIQAVPPTPVLLVDDTVAALQRLARAYRQVLREQGVKVIAVGGSNGKTTTRHLIHSLLSAKFRGTQSFRSFNNHLGVPLTLLGASVNDDFVVVEIGTNHPGEVASLCQIVQPDAGVVTSIGHEHMEFFQTLEGVAAEEAALLQYIAAEGLAVVPGDEPLLAPHLERVPVNLKLVRFGTSPECSPRLLNCRLQTGNPTIDGVQVTFAGDGISANTTEAASFFLPLLGEHNARNALAALAVGRWMGMELPEIIAALGHATGVSMRMEVRRLQGLVVLSDCYNANPDSVTAALATLAEYPNEPRASASGPQPGADGSLTVAARQGVATRRRVAILGDMRELGEQGPDLHREVGRRLSEQSGIDTAVLIGKLSLFTAEALSRTWPPQRVHAFPEWSAELPGKVAGLLQSGDVVLLKASRGMGLERLLPVIEAAFGTTVFLKHD